MSRSPFSPAGKRLKTMIFPDDTSDESDYDHDYEEDFRQYQQFEREEWEREGRLLDMLHNDVGDNEGDDEVEFNEDEDDVEDDDDDEDDEDEDDDDDEEEDEDNESNFSRDSLNSSSFIIGPNDHIINIESDDEMDYDSDDSSDIDHSQPEEYLKHDPTPETQYPKPDWITVNELRQRKNGFPSSRALPRQPNMYWFERYVNNSLWMIQRLELSKRLEEHTGCVNSLDFDSTGRLICSGGDDLSVCIWDWQLNKLKRKINSGHTSNIFHTEFCNSNNSIITSSHDGSVRLIDIESGLTESLFTQSGEIGKLTFLTPHTLVTCGTNACVNFIDLRVRELTKLFVVKNPLDTYSCALYSIDSHPLDKHKIVVAGRSPYVFLYDLRRVARNHHDVEHKPTYCFKDDKDENINNIVTSTAFNSTGDKLLISYKYDLTVCQTDTCEIIHRYRGHRNKKTIKGCTWFGDNFVMSGSDDGHIYGWDVDSEHIVCFLEGDVNGVVNYLKVHPHEPVLASSGLDHNVKVWEPFSKTWPQTLKGIKSHICRNTMRREKAQKKSREQYNLEEL